MLKFEWKGNNQWKCWNLSEKIGIDQMLKFECKMSTWSNCWNLSEKVGIDQNAEIKSEKGKSVETRGQS